MHLKFVSKLSNVFNYSWFGLIFMCVCVFSTYIFVMNISRADGSRVKIEKYKQQLCKNFAGGKTSKTKAPNESLLRCFQAWSPGIYSSTFGTDLSFLILLCIRVKAYSVEWFATILFWAKFTPEHWRGKQMVQT